MDPIDRILTDAHAALSDIRDRLTEHLAADDEFEHRLRERGDTTLSRNVPVQEHIAHVLHEIEGLRRRLDEKTA